MEPEVLFLSRQPGLRPSGCAVCRRSKRGVPVASKPALREEDALALYRQVRDLHVRPILLFFVDHRARRHLELDIRPVLAGTVRPFAMTAATGRENLLET